MIYFPNIEVKKVDSKGRIILPRKDLHEIFITELDDLIIVSKSETVLKNAIESIEEHKKQSKILALKEWEDLLQEADVLDITTKDIDKATLNAQKKKVIPFLDDNNVTDS